MRSIVRILFLLVLCITSAFGGTYGGYYNDPRYPGKCTINMILTTGQIVKDPNQECGGIICRDNGMTEFHTCGTGAVRGCSMGDYINKNLPYPECCKRHTTCS